MVLLETVKKAVLDVLSVFLCSQPSATDTEGKWFSFVFSHSKIRQIAIESRALKFSGS